MLRYFTQILIFTLILTAPLSFSGDKCPDFKPVSEISQGQEGAAEVKIVKKISVNTVYAAETSTLPEYNSTPYITLTLVQTDSRSSRMRHERAPPLIPEIS